MKNTTFEWRSAESRFMSNEPLFKNSPLFLVCDMRAGTEMNLENAKALRQSILKKAFEGKLLNKREPTEVHGKEDWEPDEVLLERLRVEKKTKRKSVLKWIFHRINRI